MRIAFVPIDNRPVSYDLIRQTAEISSDIELFLPDISLLGGLTTLSDTDKILDWLENLSGIDAFVVALDTIAYGGLVQSRRNNDDITIILQRLKRFKNIIKDKKVLAFSSIMRISNNNMNTEEKPYWEKWGKKIFQYSYDFHKFGTEKTDVPADILDDYKNTRKRNFEINKLYFEWQKDGIFTEIIFSKDDCAEYGFNIIEAEELKSLGGFVKTGADEIPLLLLAKCVDEKINIHPVFTEPDTTNLISNYEDISIAECVKNSIEFAGCTLSDKNSSDIELIVNNFVEKQGEIVMGIDTTPFKGDFIPSEKPFAVADVRFTNGSDNEFVQKLLPHVMNKNFIGYSAWNTSANTLGSLIALIKLYFYAKKHNTLNENAVKKLNLTRFLDDWAYQANIRQKLKTPDTTELNSLIKSYERELQKLFNSDYNIRCTFPWERLFEVRIELI